MPAGKQVNNINKLFKVVQYSCFAHAKRTFIFGRKCAHFSALYYVNALYVFLGSNSSFNW